MLYAGMGIDFYHVYTNVRDSGSTQMRRFANRRRFFTMMMQEIYILMRFNNGE